MEKKVYHLSKKDKTGVWVRWLLYCHSCYNYESYQGIGFTHSLSYAMKKMYPDEDVLGEELSKHTGFFNTSVHLGSMVPGVVLALEESRSNNSSISPDFIMSIKVGLMAPLAGLGDSVMQGIIIPTCLSIGILLSEYYGILGPIIYTIGMIAIYLSISYYSFSQGYLYGTEIITRLMTSGKMQKYLGFSSLVAAMVIGGLVSNYVDISYLLNLHIGDNSYILSTKFLDDLLPNFLSITMILVMYHFMKRGVKSNKLILYVYLVAVVVSVFSFFEVIS